MLAPPRFPACALHPTRPVCKKKKRIGSVADVDVCALDARSRRRRSGRTAADAGAAGTAGGDVGRVGQRDDDGGGVRRRRPSAVGAARRRGRDRFVALRDAALEGTAPLARLRRRLLGALPPGRIRQVCHGTPDLYR